MKLILSCEHAGNRVPKRYARFFEDRTELLESHKAYDKGAKELASTIARTCMAPLFLSRITRLLVDVNRSPLNRGMYSEISRRFSVLEKTLLFRRYHDPHWNAVSSAVQKCVDLRRRVLHLSVHTFTPVFHGKTRRADIGLLYDPSRKEEMIFCKRLQKTLAGKAPQLAVRRNYPYKGISDGIATALRRKYTPDTYLGVEIEVNQKHVFEPGRYWSNFSQMVADAVMLTLKETRRVRRNTAYSSARRR